MFDFDRVAPRMYDFFLNVLRKYDRDKRAEFRRFVEAWTDLLRMYSKRPFFVGFEPPVPLPYGLVPDPVGLLVTYHLDPDLDFVKRSGVSVLSLYPFAVKFQHKTESHRDEELDLLFAYLDLSDVRTVGFHDVRPWTERKVTEKLRERYGRGTVVVYGSSSFRDFLGYCRLRNAERGGSG